MRAGWGWVGGGSGVGGSEGGLGVGRGFEAVRGAGRLQ